MNGGALVDLGLALGLNYGVSMKAAASPTLRWQLGSGDSFFTDGRFLFGAAGVALEQLGTGLISRGGGIAAEGLLHSLMTGETYRAKAIANAAAAAGGAVPAGAAAPQQLHGAGGWYPPPHAQQVGGFDFAPGY